MWASRLRLAAGLKFGGVTPGGARTTIKISPGVLPRRRLRCPGWRKCKVIFCASMTRRHHRSTRGIRRRCTLTIPLKNFMANRSDESRIHETAGHALVVRVTDNDFQREVLEKLGRL